MTCKTPFRYWILVAVFLTGVLGFWVFKLYGFSALAYWIFLFGVGAAAEYLVLYDCLSLLPPWSKEAVRQNQQLHQLMGQIRSPASKMELADRLAGREESMIQMGSIFIAGAFLLIAGATQSAVSQSLKPPLAIGAPILYAWWLFSIQLSTRLMHDAQAEILVQAQIVPAKILREIYGDRHGKTLIMRLRRNHWLAYLLVLAMLSSMIVG